LCNNCSKWFVVSVEFPPVEDTLPEEYGKLVDLDNNNRFIVTSAQNNTPVDGSFWKSLQMWADYYKAQILVIPMLYKVRPDPEQEIWWAPEVIPYLIKDEIQLAKGIRIFGDLKINATAVNPLAGLESISQGDSAIIGHTQIQMRTVATPQHKLPKILQTTGTTTQKNYKEGKAGKKGSFHHSLGGVIVELDDANDTFFIRGVTGNSKSEFYDLDLHCTPRGAKLIKKIPGIVLGDEHEKFHCPDVRAATFDDQASIVNILKPKFIVRHDVSDMYSISHHHAKSPSIKFRKYMTGNNNLHAELEDTAVFLEETTPKFSTSVVVPSNHHNHLKQWLETVEWRDEMHNARIYHQLWDAWLEALELRQSFDPYTWWLRKNCKANVMYLMDDYPFIIKDIYVGYHGDRGANGARGSLAGWAKIGAKTIVGHTHSPGIEKGCYMVGTSSELNLEYTSGPSSWMNTHCIIHEDGKRQLITIINGEWRKW
jgi:hypothetical protein